MFAAWDAVFDFLTMHAWATGASLLTLLCAALIAYARDEIHAGTNWALGPITRSFPWNGPKPAGTAFQPRLNSDFTLVDLFLLDPKGKLARYQKTSSYLATEKTTSYQEGVTADGRADSFSTMRGTIVRTSREHGFYVSRIDLGEGIEEGSRVTNVYAADLHDCFISQHEQWTQELAFPAKHLTIQIHFPEKRPPKSATCKTVEGTVDKPATTTAKIVELYGKKSIVWEIDQPKANAIFKLEWIW